MYKAYKLRVDAQASTRRVNQVIVVEGLNVKGTVRNVPKLVVTAFTK